MCLLTVDMYKNLMNGEEMSSSPLITKQQQTKHMHNSCYLYTYLEQQRDKQSHWIQLTVDNLRVDSPDSKKKILGFGSAETGRKPEHKRKMSQGKKHVPVGCRGTAHSLAVGCFQPASAADPRSNFPA